MLGELCQPTGTGPELFHKFMMNASVEMSKGNRRKQSKPNRLFADDENAMFPRGTTGSPQVDSSPRTSPVQEPMEEERDDKDPMDLSTKAVDSPSVPSLASAKSPTLNSIATSRATAELEMVNFPCHTCGEMFPSRAQQEQHITDRHSTEVTKPNPSPPSFPTAYHRLATELGLGPLTPGMLLPSNKSSTDQRKSSPGINNTTGSLPNMGTPGVGGKGSSGTVFQREAYCEICQREFCNKYFLKTHKANIHGIIDPSDPKAASVMAKVNQSPKLNNNNNTSPKHEPAVCLPQQSQRMPVLQSAGAAGPIGGAGMHGLAGLATSASGGMSTASGAEKKFNTNESMEDFCDICQKHFCNKYYLKKHKVDVHNIRPDGSKPPTSSDNQLDTRTIGPMSHVPTVSSAGLPPLPMMVPPLNSLNPTSMNNMLFVNPFVPSMAAMSMVPPMMQHQFFMPGMSNLAAAHAASQAFGAVSPSEIKNEPKLSSVMPMLERGESISDADKAEAFCNLCRKEFCNSYFLQIHRASKHGIFDDAATSAALMMSMAGAAEQKDQSEGYIGKGSASPASSTASNAVKPVVLKSDRDRHQISPAFSLQGPTSTKFDQTQSMMPSALSFDAMLAAKQADRIMCDICNKEVCNKYFLKAHKLKMHGISSPPEDRRTTPTKDVRRENNNLTSLPALLAQPPHQTQQQVHQQPPVQLPQQLPQPPPLHLSSPSDPSHSHLIKLGIDPEAYCFLCKKEFCSKYFLMSHKLNIHGFKAEGSETVSTQRGSTAPRGTITPPTSVSPVSATSPVQAQAPPAIGLSAETFQWRWKDSGSERKQGKVNSASPVNDVSGGMAAASDQFTWRWKEPANATRVFCDICNKELCNKYFLRTHKLNKHGIAMNDSGDSGMMASSMMADLARASQATHNSSSRVGDYTDRCQSPNYQSHSSSPTELDQQDAMRSDVCQVCGMVFSDVVAVDEHIRMEHADEMFETPKSMVSKTEHSADLYNCTQCPYKTSEWQKMRSHETRKHNADINTCQTCQITFSHIHMLMKHMREIHDKQVTLAGLQALAGEKLNDNGIHSKKSLRCNHCSERFATRELRQSHIHSAHKKRTATTSGSKFMKLGDRTNKVSASHSRVYACDRCNYTCGTLRNLRFHQAMKHKCKPSVDSVKNGTIGQLSSPASTTMQEFDVSSVSGADSIAKSTIVLPVYKKISDGATIQLTLVPSKLIN